MIITHVNFSDIPSWLSLLFAFVTALTITMLAIPPIISLARAKKLYDEPHKRGVHKLATPTLGGIAIFAGFKLSILIFTDPSDVLFLPYIAAGCLIIFFVGLKDDIFVLSPYKKLLSQIAAATLVVLLTDIRITDLHGIFGLREIPDIVSVLLSIFIIVVITNSVNLIDGIDGLASSIGIIAAISFGMWFYVIGLTQWVIICAALAGALLGFLRFNLRSNGNKIFMGDTGSLLTGFMLACIAITFNQANLNVSEEFRVHSAPAVAIGILFIPLWDTLRVMIIRISKRRSPFKADMNHVHHVLLKLGYTHVKATLILSAASIGFIILSYFLQEIGIFWLLLVQCCLAVLLYVIPFTVLIRKFRTNISVKMKRQYKPKLSDK